MYVIHRRNGTRITIEASHVDIQVCIIGMEIWSQKAANVFKMFNAVFDDFWAAISIPFSGDAATALIERDAMLGRVYLMIDGIYAA